MLEKAKKTIDKLLELALIILMGANVLNVLWQVFTRFALKDPSSFTEELARYFLIWVGLLGASYAAGKKMHLAIDVVLQTFKNKKKIWAEIGIQIFVFLFSFSVMVIGGLRLATITLTLNQISAALRIKLGYVYMVLPLSGMLIMFYASVFIIERLRALSGKQLEVEAVVVESQEGI
ncbi:MAG: TRAP transporter small permease [Candidatus Aminicenantes bacterium]|nr:MAG: TRAP transporter small permease [Candidatus Aminicenantes bacterium]